MAINNSILAIPHQRGGTYLGAALKKISPLLQDGGLLVVLTDGDANDFEEAENIMNSLKQSPSFRSIIIGFGSIKQEAISRLSSTGYGILTANIDQLRQLWDSNTDNYILVNFELSIKKFSVRTDRNTNRFTLPNTFEANMLIKNIDADRSVLAGTKLQINDGSNSFLLPQSIVINENIPPNGVFQKTVELVLLEKGMNISRLPCHLTTRFTSPPHTPKIIAIGKDVEMSTVVFENTFMQFSPYKGECTCEPRKPFKFVLIAPVGSGKSSFIEVCTSALGRRLQIGIAVNINSASHTKRYEEFPLGEDNKIIRIVDSWGIDGEASTWSKEIQNLWVEGAMSKRATILDFSTIKRSSGVADPPDGFIILLESTFAKAKELEILKEVVEKIYASYIPVVYGITHLASTGGNDLGTKISELFNAIGLASVPSSDVFLLPYEDVTPKPCEVNKAYLHLLSRSVELGDFYRQRSKKFVLDCDDSAWQQNWCAVAPYAKTVGNSPILIILLTVFVGLAVMIACKLLARNCFSSKMGQKSKRATISVDDSKSKSTLVNPPPEQGPTAVHNNKSDEITHEISERNFKSSID